MIQDQRVILNGKIAGKANLAIEPGDDVRVLEQSPAGKATLPFRIVFEDRDVMVIDKPPGLLTSTVPREPRQTALGLIGQYLAESDRASRVGVVHRLDRDASGLLVFSKNEPAFQSLKGQFFRHTVTRIYAAIVSPEPKEAKGRIESKLVEWADGSVRSTTAPRRGQLAITDYEVVARDREIALLRVTLSTGRKHQIRAQFSEAGWPIIGDKMYRGKPSEAGLMLAAVELSFDHPRTGKRLTFKIDPGKRMQPMFSRFKDCGELTHSSPSAPKSA
jgi:RluA family pseudouridine synthase